MLPRAIPFASPFTSTSRLTLDDDLGVPEPVPKPKPKGKAKTPPKYRPPKELPQLDEDDLEEQFVRGSGPGGQATNKTSNAVSLIHKPTGTRVFCHETRSRETNRKLARRTMREKLDELFSPPGESARDLKAQRERQKAAAKKRKARRKADAKSGATPSEDRGVEGEPGEGELMQDER
ncbi:putative Aminoacyl-tRNA hydrolase [Rhodotorula taiwanensis]|uniref:Putative Aminoacyl-tRNA hydrolase n=1 Tax=Rhodotorula taiwanensis TaxID=741276 RepID=A0A2S5BIL5_9BASI|nr:putative Aminoacyl-tRNA hydrolase [Rhodotorula taiwanensis]